MTQQPFKFMSFKGTKNALGNTAIILVILFLVLGISGGKSKRKCSCGGDTAEGNTSNTDPTTPKYIMPAYTQESVVTRRPIGLFTSKM